MTTLTSNTQQLIEKLFPEPERANVAHLLERECGTNLPFCEKYTPLQLERFQFAALKLSEGDMSKLLTAIKVAKVDWRDLLVAAGFHHSVIEHQRWCGRILGTPTVPY